MRPARYDRTTCRLVKNTYRIYGRALAKQVGKNFLHGRKRASGTQPVQLHEQVFEVCPEDALFMQRCWPTIGKYVIGITRRIRHMDQALLTISVREEPMHLLRLKVQFL
jgi:hypothetical protein